MDESSLLCPNFIYKTLEKVHIIINRLKKSYSWQKSYADHRRRELEFEEGDKVYLKKISRDFVRKGSPRYVGP